MVGAGGITALGFAATGRRASSRRLAAVIPSPRSSPAANQAFSQAIAMSRCSGAMWSWLSFLDSFSAALSARRHSGLSGMSTDVKRLGPGGRCCAICASRDSRFAAVIPRRAARSGAVLQKSDQQVFGFDRLAAHTAGFVPCPEHASPGVAVIAFKHWEASLLLV